MPRVNWLICWDMLASEIEKKNSWGKNELKELMQKIERGAVRALEEAEDAKG